MILILFQGLLISLICLGCEKSIGTSNEGVPSRRIASVNLTGDEILADLLDPSRVVLVTSYVDDPEVSNILGHYPKNITRILQADIEWLLSVEADFAVLSSFHTADFLDVMNQISLVHFRIPEIRSGNDVESAYLELGSRLGVRDRAEIVVDKMRRDIAAIELKLQGIAKRPKVLYFASGFTAGANTLLDEMIVRAGGINVASEMGLSGFVPIETERIVAEDPEVLLSDQWEQLNRDQAPMPKAFSALSAVINDRQVQVPGKWLATNSRHWVKGIDALARILHPERFGEKSPIQK